MSPATLSLLVLAAVSASVRAQVTGTYPATPLASLTFSYPSGIPYQVDPNAQLIRGPQQGYNICNGTTQNQQSLCQTSWVNSVDDFCLWAPMNPNSIVADTEGEMVAWCTKPGHGTRLIPKNALKGVQYMRTPAYAQVVGFIDQTFIDLQADDYGGEMDPHGADLRGNPLGGLMYSSAFGNGIEQVIEWNNFMGGNAFCIKVCDPANPNAANFCQHIYDRIGCAYNSPNNAQNGTFEACLGDNQDYPGIYTDASGAVQTYTQPPESLGPITTMPYQPKVPASSSCTTYTSSVLYSDLLSVTAPGDTTTSAPASTGTAKPSGSGSASGSKTGTAGGAQNTSNSAEMLVAGGMATAFGVIFSAMFFA